MELCFLNPPVVSSLEERKARAQTAIEILQQRVYSGFDKQDNRWKVWIDMHQDMADRMDVDTLLEFQSDWVLGGPITGGSGKHFLSMLSEIYGQQKLNLYLQNHTETLCGQPKDLVFEQDRYITVTSMRHLYHLAQLKEYVDTLYRRPVSFVEIGGGFGNLARMVCQYQLCDKYYIVDHPVMHAIQYFYLGEFFAPEDIAIVSEQGEFLTGSSTSKVQLYSSIAPQMCRQQITSPYILASTMALTEIPREYQDEYMRIFAPELIYIFGQLRNEAVGGGKSAQALRFSNEGLVFLLGERYHTLYYRFHGYHFEYIGRCKVGR